MKKELDILSKATKYIHNYINIYGKYHFCKKVS